MTETVSRMTRERFADLAEAYGGDVARWPEDVRDAAAELMSAEPAFAGDALGRAGALDAALDAWRPSAASADVRARIIASAPAPLPRWRLWLSPAALGAGLAAACVAGVIAGAQLSQRTGEASEVAVTNTLTAVSTAFELEVGA